MGTDIHFFTEVKVDGEWYCKGHPYISRNYELFGVLAGVRCQELQAFPVKGLPKDLSKVVNMNWEWQKSDWHTPSYLTSDEIKQFYKLPYEWAAWCESYLSVGLAIGYLNGNSWQPPFPAGVEDVRWVFWFDC